MLALKRVYDKASPEDGVRFLVERLWPRGIKKTDLRLDAWLKDVAPSATLRRWFAHDLKKWTKLQRYFAELDSHPEACEQIRSAARHGRVILVYSSHDTEHNNAVALKEYLNVRKAGDALDVLFGGVICSGSIAHRLQRARCPAHRGGTYGSNPREGSPQLSSLCQQLLLKKSTISAKRLGIEWAVLIFQHPYINELRECDRFILNRLWTCVIPKASPFSFCAAPGSCVQAEAGENSGSIQKLGSCEVMI